MNNRYQSEIDDFRKNFREHKDKRIVLYGIGRYTATLLENIKDYNFVGLMDKDSANVGKEMFGLSIIDVTRAERDADLVVINTSETYWSVIYNRIRGIKIPVYYKNGRKAKAEDEGSGKNIFKDLAFEKIIQQIDEADVISFDFFDTLFVRKVCSPGDVFSLLQREFKDKWTSDIDYKTARSLAREKMQDNYTLQEIYEQIEKTAGITKELSYEIMKRELELEKSLLVLRKKIAEALLYAINKNKEVYIVTDMYVPVEFYKDLLKTAGMPVGEDKIIVSSAVNKNKTTGDIWNLLREKVGFGKKIFHIGDNLKSDVERPKQYEIMTGYAPSPWAMLSGSSLSPIGSEVVTDFASAVMGLVKTRLFNNPYRLVDSIKPKIDSNIEMGYCVFGPVILTFLSWLEKERIEDGIARLIFMSRDGYFLSRAYEGLCEDKGLKANYKYIIISRQLAMTASIETEKGFEEYLNMPYSGTKEALIEDRFGISEVKPGKEDTIESIIESNREEIDKWIGNTRDYYREYIIRQGLKDSDAIVDLGFYGNNQRYLNKISGRNLRGYYVNANLSEKNENTRLQEMKACFQSKDDVAAESSEILRRSIFLESFLTAPQGMVRGMNEEGVFVYAKPGSNQEHFKDKEEIFKGVMEFIKDYTDIFSKYNLEADISFIDKYYGLCFNGSMEYSDKVKASFFNDNAMMNRLESQLFY